MLAKLCEQIRQLEKEWTLLKSMALTAVFLLIVAKAVRADGPLKLHPRYVALWSERNELVSQENGKNLGLQYRLFVPNEESTTMRLPLIVWLHGAGESGSDNLNQLRWLDSLIFLPPRNRERFPFLVLAVQCPAWNGAWNQKIGINKLGETDMLDVVAVVVEKTIREESIDPDKVTLAGLSNGGSACWELAVRRPDLFAAVAPLGSSGFDYDLEKLIDIPIWAFHGKNDATIPITYVKKTVAGLRNAGGHVQLTETDGNGHDCWSAAFSEYELLDWLLGQRKGSTPWLKRPGKVSVIAQVSNLLEGWTWWQIILQLCVLALPLYFSGHMFRAWIRAS